MPWLTAGPVVGLQFVQGRLDGTLEGHPSHLAHTYSDQDNSQVPFEVYIPWREVGTQLQVDFPLGAWEVVGRSVVVGVGCRSALPLPFLPEEGEGQGEGGEGGYSFHLARLGIPKEEGRMVSTEEGARRNWLVGVV